MPRKISKSKTLFLTLIAALSFFILTSAPLASEQDKVYKWTMQGFAPEGTLFQDWAHEWVDLVETLSNGRIDIKLHPPGAIVPSLEGIYAVRDGVLDAHYGYSAMWIGHNIAAPMFASTPGYMTPLDYIMWIYQGEGLELWQEMMDGVNAKVLPGTVIGMEIFMWADEPLKSIEDFKGKTLRMMPLMGKIIQEYGREYNISVEFIAAAEVIPALERGVVDAAEYSIPAFDETLGFHDVADYYHFPGFHQPATMGEILINKDRWNELPEDLQKIVEMASEISLMRNWREGEMKNIKALERFDKAGKKKVILDDEVVELFMDWSNKWFEKASKEHEFLGRVRESQVEFLQEWYPYKDNTELPMPKWALE